MQNAMQRQNNHPNFIVRRTPERRVSTLRVSQLYLDSTNSNANAENACPVLAHRRMLSEASEWALYVPDLS